MADSAEPVEVTALRTNLVFITDAVTVGGTPQWFADRLVEKAFITHRDAQGILSTLGVSPAQKASQLMNSVFAKIDLSDDKRRVFLDFVDIFSHDLVYKHLVNKLMRGGMEPKTCFCKRPSCVARCYLPRGIFNPLCTCARRVTVSVYSTWYILFLHYLCINKICF